MFGTNRLTSRHLIFLLFPYCIGILTLVFIGSYANSISDWKCEIPFSHANLQPVDRRGMRGRTSKVRVSQNKVRLNVMIRGILRE